jgi:hypothetical protein
VRWLGLIVENWSDLSFARHERGCRAVTDRDDCRDLRKPSQNSQLRQKPIRYAVSVQNETTVVGPTAIGSLTRGDDVARPAYQTQFGSALAYVENENCFFHGRAGIDRM